MKAIFVFAGLQLATALAMPSSEITAEWENYKVKYGKVYQNPKVDRLRMIIYLETKQMIMEENEKFKKGKITWSEGMNQFGDMLGSEMYKIEGNGIRPDPIVKFKQEWENYKVKYRKFYHNSEVDKLRMLIYLQSKHEIKELNEQYENGHISWSSGLNQFSDMLGLEFYENLNHNIMMDNWENQTMYQSQNTTPRNIVDWRKEGIVTPIKDQGNCGSCWAFSTTGTLEGQHALKNKKLVSLSEQQLVDCSGAFGNIGCYGGNPVWALRYIESNGGIESESAYPYIGTSEKHACSFNKKNVGATVKQVVGIRSGNEADLLKAVSDIGPISVALDANHKSFKHYKKGIYNNPKCSSKVLNHAALVVGYGEENGEPYWLIKNSWGTHWGYSGYMTLRRNVNRCGVATQACFPLV